MNTGFTDTCLIRQLAHWFCLRIPNTINVYLFYCYPCSWSFSTGNPYLIKERCGFIKLDDDEWTAGVKGQSNMEHSSNMLFDIQLWFYFRKIYQIHYFVFDCTLTIHYIRTRVEFKKKELFYVFSHTQYKCNFGIYTIASGENHSLLLLYNLTHSEIKISTCFFYLFLAIPSCIIFNNFVKAIKMSQEATD